MRKFFGLIFILIVFTSSAQLKLGINAGYQIAQFSISGGTTSYYDLSAINGYHAGLIADDQLSKHFYLDIELQFSHKGGIVNKSSQSLYGSNYTLDLNYLELPVTLDYKLPISKTSKFILGAGLYTAVGLSGKIKGTTSYASSSVPINFDDKVTFTNDASNTNINAIKPMDWGYIFNTGIEWKKYQFKFNYSHSFGSIKPAGSTKFANLDYGISAAYLLPW